MYNVYNLSEVFYLWDIQKQELSLIGNEKDLIHLLAKHYRKNYSLWDNDPPMLNEILNNFGCNVNETNKLYQIFDGLDRCINPKVYEREAYQLYLKLYKNQKYKEWSVKDKTYKGEFRKEPVAGLRRPHGGPSCKLRKTARIKRMYANPEYKDFNRGSLKEIPKWWDDQKFRCRQRSWKSHRKHQWK